MEEKNRTLRDVFNRLRRKLIVFAIIVAIVSGVLVARWNTGQPNQPVETEIVRRAETFVDLNMTNMGRTHVYLTSDTILNATIEWSASNRVMAYASWHANKYCYDFSHGTVDGEWVYGGFLFRQVGMKGIMYLGPDYFDLTDGRFWSFGWNSQFLYGGEMYYYGHVNMTYTVTLFVEREVEP